MDNLRDTFCYDSLCYAYGHDRRRIAITDLSSLSEMC